MLFCIVLISLYRIMEDGGPSGQGVQGTSKWRTNFCIRGAVQKTWPLAPLPSRSMSKYVIFFLHAYIIIFLLHKIPIELTVSFADKGTPPPFADVSAKNVSFLGGSLYKGYHLFILPLYTSFLALRTQAIGYYFLGILPLLLLIAQPLTNQICCWKMIQWACK